MAKPKKRLRFGQSLVLQIIEGVMSLIKKAYEYAVSERYRSFSYGDSILTLFK